MIRGGSLVPDTVKHVPTRRRAGGGELAHHIFANDQEQADVLAGMFETDGYPVRWARHRPGGFIELEVGDVPSVVLESRLRR